MKYFLLITSLLILPFTLFASHDDFTKSKGTTQDVIVHLMPSPAQEDVSRYTKIEASFSVPLDAKHVKKFDVKLKCLSCKAKNNIQGTVGYIDTDNKITFTPAETLTPGVYEVEFKSLKTDKAYKQTKIKEIKYRFVIVKEVLESISVTPNSINLIEGETQQLTVIGHYNNGTQNNIIPLVEWIVGNNQTISVNENGLVTARIAGNTNLKAKLTGVVEAGEVVSNDVPIKVLIPDVIPPVITLNGDSNITLTQGESYEELGATAIDDRDGDVNVTISGSADTSIEGIYTITYVAVDNAENKAMALRTVNVKNNEPILKSLVLSADKTHFVRTKDPFYNDYRPVKVPVKVIATYSDEHREEVTDRVEWINLQGNIVSKFDYLEAKGGTHIFQASLGDINSNEITINVEDDTSLVQYEVSYKNETELSIGIRLLNQPREEVSLTLNLGVEDKVVFIDNEPLNPTQSYTMTFKPQEWGTVNDVQYVKVKILDHTMTSPITIITEPMVSDDPNYSNKNPKEIVVDREEELVLTPPSIQQRRGAIRGVRIAFEITQGDKEYQTISLVNPPNGMKILRDIHSEGIPPFGVVVQWDIPMDVKEGIDYNITAKATGTKGREKTITFPITIPKTTPIQTKVENNELIVIDKNSLLYGMKMKGHNGEDVSLMKLRSVKYEDVWKHNGKPLDNTKPLSFTVFVIDNMPEKTDIKFPPYMDTFEKRIALGAGFDRYTEGFIVKNFYWNMSSFDGEIYVYEGTNGVTFPSTYSLKQKGNRSQMFIFTMNEDF